MSNNENRWISPNTRDVLNRFETLAGRPATVLTKMSVADILERKKKLALEQQRMDNELYKRFEQLSGRKPIAAMTESEKLRYISQQVKENNTKRRNKTGGHKSISRKLRSKKKTIKMKMCDY